ncbi:hypothetical protein L6452_06241 [Arctium lappa]|uniref:Uncharacterized protein n=1 Tax=Arctium lappa TaxID=4217 RepID=A0ACB9EIN4_ARCLA|nr:hypothetical protein L6452_06241 [Arctium lappa]
MSSEPEPQRSTKQKVSAVPSPTIIQITESPPPVKDKGKAIATEPLKKIKSPPPTSKKLLKSSFVAFKRVKPEEEDWAFDLQPLSELPILKPLDTPSEDRVMLSQFNLVGKQSINYRYCTLGITINRNALVVVSKVPQLCRHPEDLRTAASSSYILSLGSGC